MRIDEFIEEFKKLNTDDKVDLVNGLITTEYVSYATKMTDCKRIIDSTSYTNTEPNMFCINSPARHMLLNLQLIERYTDLEIDYNNALEIYDMLDEAGAIDYIITSLPTKEVSKYCKIMKMMLKDFKMNERSMIGYLDSKLASLGIIGETLNNLIESTVESESEDMTE